MSEKGLKEFHSDEEFPENYEILEKIKSPLNVLWYNVNSIFPDNYPAKMPQDFARDMILFYSKKGDTVFDGFNGSGTVPRIANKLGRIGIGTDVNPKAIKLSQDHDPSNADRYWQSDLKKVNLDKKVDLILTSPPFGISIAGDKNNYSDEVDDLSNSKSIEEFLEKIRPCFQSYFDNLKPNGILIFDARDRTKDSKYYDLSVIFRNMCLEIGFKVHAKFFYFLMPYRLYTYKNHDNKQIMPNVSTMDVYCLYKGDDQKLENFNAV